MCADTLTESLQKLCKKDKLFFINCESSFKKACNRNDVESASALLSIMRSTTILEASFKNACAQGNFAIAMWLLSAGHICNSNISIVFLFACIQGRTKMVETLATDFKDYLNNHIYFTGACHHNQLPVAKWLLNNSAQVFDTEGRIPALIPHKNNTSVKIVDLLLQNNKDISLTVSDAFVTALKNNNKDMVHKLIDYGDNIKHMDVHHFIKYEYVDKVKDIINEQNYRSIFQNACRCENIELIDWIYQKYCEGREISESNSVLDDSSISRTDDLSESGLSPSHSSDENDDECNESGEDSGIHSCNKPKRTATRNLTELEYNLNNIFNNVDINIILFCVDKKYTACIKWIISKDYKVFVENFLNCHVTKLDLELTKLQKHVINVIQNNKNPSIALFGKYELDDISFYALCYYNKIVLLMILTNMYPHIVFNVDINGKVVDYYLNSVQIKSARKNNIVQLIN